jgi:hypothetical protein
MVMDLGLLSNALLWAVLAAFFIARQFMPRPVRGRAMIVIPLIGGYLGLQALGKAPPDSFFAAGLLGFNLIVAVVTGVARGATIRLWEDRTGTLMMQGTLITFGCWLISIALKVGLGFAARGVMPMDELPLFLGVTFGAQNLVVWFRAQGMSAVTGAVRAR